MISAVFQKKFKCQIRNRILINHPPQADHNNLRSLFAKLRVLAPSRFNSKTSEASQNKKASVSEAFVAKGRIELPTFGL
jgi:hypothetical protein